MSLVIVISVGAVLTIFVTIMMSYGLAAYGKSASDQRWNAAMAAAYAGIEEYQSRLANEPAYLRYGNPASAFSAGSVVQLPPDDNPAFGLGETGTWATIPGSNGDSEFRYEVDNSEYATTGNLRIRSTGRVGDATRTIVADLRQQGFIDFLYFTDLEMQDTNLSGAATSCERYHWLNPRPTSCSNIAFGNRDVLNGPVHSNDTIRACGTEFNGTVTTANPSTPRVLARTSAGAGCGSQGNPRFTLPGYPAFAPQLELPQTNTQMRREVRSDLPIDVPRPGCLYTGPTKITLHSNGEITVYSPWTRATRIAGQPATTGSAPSACGDISRITTGSGHRFTPPENNLIYVQNVPSVNTDPNFWRSDQRPAGLNCTGAGNNSVEGGGSVVGNGIGYPIRFEQLPRLQANSYQCRVGDVFVEGSMSGKITIAAENFIYITGNIAYRDSQEDILGLVGNNSIFVWNPVNSSGQALLSDVNRRIDAAMLSVERTIQVQNFYRGGDRGDLIVNGAMGQKFRGIVRQGTATVANGGYDKEYNYDPRLRYTAPPKFLSPVTTTYGINVWIETERAFNADGSAR
ncbi:hypothetical protein EV141_1914 [Microcella putealis]|uniref:Tfp pilus assembly protein PilX n=1 Tax=Microcella putealis TaxID=337005 RepID=A0A4V2EWL9_9MICO|nr:hypothetical protein [Microcella putealis]RZS56450.1 hypothetical protein EV141_1914 [Microcella putealis]TQM27064.1 hypothetical protein BJ957_0487 [Microcella putealis]